MYQLGAKEERVMESWTIPSLPLSAAKGLPWSGAKGHNDGGPPDAGVLADQAGVRDGESEAGSPILASLFYEPVCATPSQEGAKRGNF